jgi:hypothetical protein
MTYDARNHVVGKRFELACGDQTIVVDRIKEQLYVPQAGECRVRQRGAEVHVLIASKLLQMTTPAAVKLGLALSTNGGACAYLGDLVSVNIGGEALTLLPQVAMKLGGVILKKADRADDYQRGILS